MGVTLYVGPMIDPEDEEEFIEEDRTKLETLNQVLQDMGLPPYEDPESEDENDPYWNAMYSNSCQQYLHSQIASLKDEPMDGLKFRHFLDPSQVAIKYVPRDFPEPIRLAGETEDGEEEEFFFGSCQGLLREIEQFAAAFQIPLERFEIDFSGDGEEQGENWAAIIEELKQNGAACMSMRWAPMDEETVEASLRAFCEMTGIPLDDFRRDLVKEHGSLAAYARSQSEPDEVKNSQSIYALVNHWHGCKLAIERQLVFGIG